MWVVILAFAWTADGCSTLQPSNPVRILAGGDVMAGRDIGERNRDQQREILSIVNEKIDTGDLFVFNLESPLEQNVVPINMMDLTADPNIMEFFPKNIEIAASLANNHSMDRGSSGLMQTEYFLKAYGISPVLPFPEYLGLQVGTQAVRIFAINTLEAEPQELEDFVYGLKEHCKNVFCIASIHWGEEFSVTPDAEQREYAEKLSESGVEFILGHHPHVLQEVEWLENGDTRTLVAYSMGDLVFDITLPDARRTALLKLEIAGEEILNICAQPLLIIPGSWNVVYPEQNERDKILERLGVEACRPDDSGE